MVRSSKCGAIAQLGERYSGTVEVRSSILLGSTIFTISQYFQLKLNALLALHGEFFCPTKKAQFISFVHIFLNHFLS